MKLGRAYELFVKYILINIGFSPVKSDGLYVFDGAPGQMIQGLGEAHNADVLLEPPVQTPFFSRARLLIECKDYRQKVGLNTIRSALGLREDINHFEIVDINRLQGRQNQRRHGITYNYDRFSYQVAVAAFNGFTVPAQEFAATHRIPLLEFNKMPFWQDFCTLLGYQPTDFHRRPQWFSEQKDQVTEDQIIDFANEIGQHMAVAVTNSGQLLFLYQTSGERNNFSDFYELYWETPSSPWILESGNQTYLFQLPKSISQKWLENISSDFELKAKAISCKADFLSSMIVYYTINCLVAVKMISIDEYALDIAKKRLEK